MASYSSSRRKRIEQLPSLSPLQPRYAKGPNARDGSDGAERSPASLALRNTISADGVSNASCSKGDEASITSSLPPTTLLQPTTQTSLRGRSCGGSGAPALLLPMAALNRTPGLTNASSGGLISKLMVLTGEGITETSSVSRSRTSPGNTIGDGQQTPLLRYQGSGSSFGVGSSLMSHPPLPLPARNVVFSSSEHRPHVPVLQQSSSSESKCNISSGSSNSAAAALPPQDAASAQGGAARWPAAPPFAGIFLQPSTFRIGATGLDVLQALYRSNGVVASYLDAPCSTGQSNIPYGTPSPLLTTLTNTSSALTTVTPCAPLSSLGTRGGSDAPAGVPRRAANTSSRYASMSSSSSSHQHSSTGNPPTASSSITASGFSAAVNQNTNCNGNSNNCSVPTLAEVEAEIARCLNGAGSSTPCLLSFDYAIAPARYKRFSEEEISAMGQDPLTAQLQAKEINEMEEAVLDSSRHAACTRAAASTASRGGGGSIDASEDIVSESSTAAAAAVGAAQQQQKKVLCFKGNTDVSAGGGATAGAPSEAQLRWHACGEIVQSSLYAARCSGSAHSKLFFCEPLASEGSASFTANGNIAHVLSGSTVAEGGRLMPLPLWSGVQVALATMLVGEEATFIMGPDDTTRFSVLPDGAACGRAGTSAAAASGMPGGGGGSRTFAGQDSRSSPPPRCPAVRFGVAGRDNCGMAFNTPQTRYRSSSHSTTHRHNPGGGGSVRRRRSRSRSIASQQQTSSAASSSQQSSLASSRASSVSLSIEHNRSSGSVTCSSQHAQQPQQKLQKHKPTSFFSRVREWSRRRRSSAGGKDKGKPEVPRVTASLPQPLPLPTSPTCTDSQLQRGSSRRACTPMSTVMAKGPMATILGTIKPMPPLLQRGCSTAPCITAPLPSIDAAPPEDVCAHEAASYGAVEPVMVHLRLRERIPLLPTRLTSSHPLLLISAEPVLGNGEQLSGPPAPASAAVGNIAVRASATGRLTGRSLIPPTPLPPMAPGESACQRMMSNMSTDALSLTTLATSATSESDQRRGVMADALLCIRESNIMRANLATSFHYLVHRRASMEGKADDTCAGAPLAPDNLPPSTSGGSAATLAQTVMSVLDRVEVRNAGRTALFTAMMYVMDSTLLSTRDRARVLNGSCSGAGAEEEARCDVRRAAGANTSTTTTAMPTPADGGARAAASTTTSDTASPPASTQYLWMPYFRVHDAVRALGCNWQSGALANSTKGGDSGGSSGNGRRGISSAHWGASLPRDVASVSERALRRTLEEFTRYAHDTAFVSYAVSIFNSVTRTYEPYVNPLRTADTTTSKKDVPQPINSCIGCVMHPCWLDAVLRASRHPCGTDVYVVTRGHAAGAEERLFVCAALTDIAATSQEAAAAFSSMRSSAGAEVEEADTTAPPTAAEGEADGSANTTASTLKGSLTAPATSYDTPAQPTKTTAATPATGANNSKRINANAAPISMGWRASPARKAYGNTKHVRNATHDSADGADTAARRSLEASKQLLRWCGCEQRYRVRVYSREPALAPHQFFASSPKDGLAAAHSLLVDAAVLLEFHYQVMDGLAAPLQRTSAGSSLPYAYSTATRAPRLSAAVPPALRNSSLSIICGQHYPQRLPYLLFGEDHVAIIAAATARAQAMGCGFLSSMVASAGSPHVPRGAADAAAPPSIEVLAAAMMFFSPFAASAANTLASRISLALERVLLKALPMLYLAIFLLTFGVDEAKATPALLLQHVYGPWWSQISSPHQQQQQAHSSSAQEGTASSTASPVTAAPPAQADELETLLYRRYTYLGECFRNVSLIYSELPGMRSLSWEACSMALLYLPRDAALWALWGTLLDRLGNAKESKAVLQVAVQLLAMEDGKADRRAGQGLSSEPLAETPVVLEETTERLSRLVLLQYLCEQCSQR
ncbi:hypothetical protein ABL78_5130 [Leptomonas seymouri]|uniref:Uncharacterized protein n=1 Tax=Leptomonas seymouri TaxID=5684 RepID=A0A0N1I3V9_LEPSE|nr:hypothetical protein ABL78_5130 [Leptomonas seymouri]|eukprot:KPI85802.1 hypothetical protein ABL78_5130 [Leptomonas seymouri]